MPKWGLTEESLRDLPELPWGLDLRWLRPEKVVTDPIQQDIYLNRLEWRLVDSPPFQRLRRVKQLGTTDEVYPGATHTRFSHSLGSLRTAQDLIDAVLEQRHNPHPLPDLFTEWQRSATQDREFEGKVAEVVVLARLGGLFHDITHVAFGHSVEDDLGILTPHDANSRRLEAVWRQIDEYLRTRLSEDGEQDLYENLRDTLLSENGELYKNLRPLILTKEKVEVEGKLVRQPAHRRIRYPFVADIVGNTICADLLDYLPRDHIYTGLPMALGHRFLSSFFVTPSTRARKAQRMALSIVRADRERTDVISELLKHLRYRYEQTERVLTHHAKLAADAMVGKALELWRDQLEATAASTAAGGGAGEPTTPPAQGRGGEVIHLLGAPPFEAEAVIEDELLSRGDTGLLEYLRDYAATALEIAEGEDEHKRLRALALLIDGLLNRDLFKQAGRASTQQASADDIYGSFGKPTERRRLEREAAGYAGVDDPTQIVIWLPPPEMRLKVAEVLVYDGSEVVAFNRSEAYAKKRGTDIYDAHQGLWGVSVYVHRLISYEQRQIMLAYLAREMEVRWDGWDQRFSRETGEWLDVLAARSVCRELSLGRADETIMVERERVARRSVTAPETFEALLGRYRQLAEEMKRDRGDVDDDRRGG